MIAARGPTMSEGRSTDVRRVKDSSMRGAAR
jgi:hypothetical protein